MIMFNRWVRKYIETDQTFEPWDGKNCQNGIYMVLNHEQIIQHYTVVRFDDCN